MSEKRKKAYRVGINAERIAALCMTMRGYRVLAFRFKTPVGEIDLVAASRRRVAFVEVKARTGGARGANDILYAVTPRQQQRIRRAADLWLAQNKEAAGKDIGFDIITISPWSWPRYHKDAFSHLSS